MGRPSRWQSPRWRSPSCLQQAVTDEERILEEYNKEFVTRNLLQLLQKNWAAAAAPRLIGPNFLKEAANHLQNLLVVSESETAAATAEFSAASPLSGLAKHGGGGGQRDHYHGVVSSPAPFSGF